MAVKILITFLMLSLINALFYLFLDIMGSEEKNSLSFLIALNFVIAFVSVSLLCYIGAYIDVTFGVMK